MTVVGDEVWLGWGAYIRRFTSEGIYLGSFGSEEQYVNAMTVVGDEDWLGWGAYIRRFTTDGTYLASFPCSAGGEQYVNAMVLVPEPATAMLLAFALQIVVKRARRRRI